MTWQRRRVPALPSILWCWMLIQLDSVFPAWLRSRGPGSLPLSHRRWTVFAALALALGGQASSAPLGHAADSLRTSDGKTASGSVISMSPEEVAFEPDGESIARKVAVPQVEWIAFDGEPRQLNEIRLAMRSGNYEGMVKALARLKLDGIDRVEVKQELQFYRAVALARLALAGAGGKTARTDALKLLGDLEAASPRGYRYFDICEALAELLISAGRPDEGAAWVAPIAQSRAPENKLRAAILSARIALAGAQPDAALATLDEALNISGSSKELQRYRQLAQTTRCLVLVRLDRAPEALALAEEVIQSAGDDQKELLARAYNALGAAHLQLGRKKEALLDYLHVTLLYPSHPEQHAEALGNAAPLWIAVYKKQVEAEKAKRELLERYPYSRFVSEAEE